MATLFYVLVIGQIALGVYSLWNGFEWFRMVKRRLTSHAGFYAPTTALICPCKGIERGLEDNLAALTRFEYANYEIYFTLATSLDPALKIIERVKAASAKPVHIVIAGPPEDCSEKVFNLRRAVDAIPANFEVLAFTDSDVRLPRGWLAKLVAPLQDVRVGATTTYRWIIPSGQFGAGAFSSALASAWNAAVSDDFAMTNALEAANLPIVFCPECLAATLHPWTGTQLLEFTNRQIQITRIYSPRRWRMGALAHLSYSITLIFALLFTFNVMVEGDPWLQLALITMVIPLLAVMKGVI